MPRPTDVTLASDDWIDAQGPCTTPLDAAADYVRGHFDRLLPVYLLAMVPHAVVSVLLIDTVLARHATAIVTDSVWLSAATVWRWVWLSRLQFDVQADLRGEPGRRFWGRLPAVVWVRLVSNVAITWGSLLVGIPAFYGLYLGGFAAPLLYESDAPVRARLRAGLVWIRLSGRRLFRVAMVMTVVGLVALLAVFVGQIVLVRTVLPSLVGVDTADLTLTTDSWAWRLRMCYFLALALDAYWTVACVFLYYDSQSRRMATDLRVRLVNLTKAPA